MDFKIDIDALVNMTIYGIELDLRLAYSKLYFDGHVDAGHSYYNRYLLLNSYSESPTRHYWNSMVFYTMSKSMLQRDKLKVINKYDLSQSEIVKLYDDKLNRLNMQLDVFDLHGYNNTCIDDHELINYFYTLKNIDLW